MTGAEKALEFVKEGGVVGLGSGSAAGKFIAALGERVRQGLRVCGVPTSRASEEQARAATIPVVTLEEGMPIDVTVDGADEVAPNLDLVKGYGRALVREKIVAAASRKLVILVGPERVEEKLVTALGARGKLPVEVLPFALPLCRERLRALGLEPVPFMEGSRLFVTDNGNHILDCAVGPIREPRVLESQIAAIPGIIGTGLFLGMADVVIVQRGDRLEVRERN
jgi:ribose 5-phosphate isomerase A